MQTAISCYTVCTANMQCTQLCIAYIYCTLIVHYATSSVAIVFNAFEYSETCFSLSILFMRFTFVIMAYARELLDSDLRNGW